MSARLRFLVPEGTTNTIKNPSFRYDTDGWSEFYCTMARSLDEARFGIASLQVDTDGILNNEGVFYRVSSGLDGFISGSAYLRGAGVLRLRLIDYPTGSEYVSDEVVLLADRWQRVEVLGRASGSDDFRLYIETSGATPQEVLFWVDGTQVENKSEATTYCDGDQAGCYWDLIEHGSLSHRNPSTRAGGRWIDLAGPKCEKQNLYMTVVGGMGFAPIVNNVQSYAYAPGAFWQGLKVQSRVITLSFYARKDFRPRRNGLPSLRALHKLREELIDVVKPDRGHGGEAFTLEYCDGEIKLYLKVRYDGGLTGEWDVRNEFFNSFPLRLLAVSPFFVEDDRETDVLLFREKETVNYALGRVNGEWGALNGGFDDLVRAFEIGTRGEVIAVGDFSLANNDILAIDPMIFANHVAFWDGEKWAGYGTGANGIVRCVAIAPNGYIYVGGDFTSIGGVAANRIAFWDGSGWNAMGSGLDASCHAIAVAPNGDVYIGGEFTSPSNYVVKWDGGSYIDMGANNGLNEAVYSIAITQDGSSVFLGGAFTDENSDPGILSLNYVAEFLPDFLQYFDMGTGFDAAVRKLLYLPSGRLYAGGDFTESNDSNLILLYMAYWNGSAWFEIGTGTDNVVRDLALSKFGDILIGGDFDRIGSADSAYGAWWNGSAFVNLDVVLENAVYAVAMDRYGNLFFAPNGTSAEFARITTVDNIGSAETSPLIYVVGPCTLLWIENQTTKKRVYTDIDIAENEEVLIDFAHGTIESNVRGSLAYAINPGSDLRAWTLLPGENKIAMLMTDDVNAVARISYAPRHWSADATARTEEL